MALETSQPSVADRIKGAIIGVCVGDALGGPVQFKRRGTFRPVTGFRYISSFDKPAGAWSDDGSLTLCLSQSLIDSRLVFSKLDAANKFCDWLYKGLYSSDGHAWDVGNSTRLSLLSWNSELRKARTSGTVANPIQIQQRVDEKLKLEQFSGNGSLMRVAPIGVSLYGDLEAAVKAARDQSDVTHPYPVCADACEIYTRLIVRIMNGETSKQALADSIDASKIANLVLRERLQKHRSLDDWKSMPDADIKTSGWVVDTLEASLWAFFVTDDFETGALRIVNFGDDSDTVGAVYGGLAGAYYGLNAISEKLRTGLVKAELVERVATDLASAVTTS